MMLYNELPTAFPWYDKKEKQQRYRENAQQVCDYRLISPQNGLLPFQFKQDYYEIDSLVSPSDYIDGSYVDNNGRFDNLPEESPRFVRTGFIPVIPGRTIHISRGRHIGHALAFYDSSYTFISGFNISGTNISELVPDDAAFVVANVSNTAEKWPYDKKVFKMVYDEPVPRITPGNPTSWRLETCCGKTIDLTNNLPLISRKWYDDGIRIFYKGNPLTVIAYGNAENELSLPPDKYFSVITFEDGTEYFSEIFTIPDDRFKIGERSKYMRLDFWNTCDIDPIAYNDGAGGWKQTMYIDSFIHASDPEVEEDGERDGNDMLIPTFQRMVVRYRFSAIVPDYMKIAIVSLQLHDNVWITTENETRSGRADRISTSTSIDDNGAYSTIDAIIDQYVMVKKACCSNIDLIDAS